MTGHYLMVEPGCSRSGSAYPGSKSLILVYTWIVALPCQRDPRGPSAGPVTSVLVLRSSTLAVTIVLSPGIL